MDSSKTYLQAKGVNLCTIHLQAADHQIMHAAKGKGWGLFNSLMISKLIAATIKYSIE